jgi:hypothetical protein
MRDQYAGDISDVLKFAFLRTLAGQDKTLGVAWYYVPVDDGGPDGQHLEWQGEAAKRCFRGLIDPKNGVTRQNSQKTAV